MKANFIPSTFAVFLLCIFLYSCKSQTKTETETTNVVKKDSIDSEKPNFLNSLNLPEMDFPAIGHFSSANGIDTLELDVKESEEYLYDFMIFSKNDKKNPLTITIASEIRMYDEGDLDGDGTNEIGILPGYNTSACRNYVVYSFAKHKWKLLFSVSSHLPDREQGIDYVKKQGDSIRILSANDDCCGCFGLDTAYVKVNQLRK
jgi:hypothetical protein